MKPAALLLTTIVLAACEGPTGAQGPQGPTGPPGNPFPRDASYCTQSAGVSAGSSWTVSVTCGQVADIPIQGWCYAPDLPAGAFLASSTPVDWPDTTKVAGWTCTWDWQGGSTPAAFGGTAEICCATTQ